MQARPTAITRAAHVPDCDRARPRLLLPCVIEDCSANQIAQNSASKFQAGHILCRESRLMRDLGPKP